MFHVNVLWVTLPFSFFPANRYGFLNMTWFLWGRGGNYCSHLALLKQVLIWLSAIISASLLIFYMGTYGKKRKEMHTCSCREDCFGFAISGHMCPWEFGLSLWIWISPVRLQLWGTRGEVSDSLVCFSLWTLFSATATRSTVWSFLDPHVNTGNKLRLFTLWQSKPVIFTRVWCSVYS